MVTLYQAGPDPVLQQIDLELRELKGQRFNTFHQYRDLDGLWNRLVQRKLPEAIPARLAAQQDGIDFESPDPAKAIQDHVAVLKLNPPNFDVHVPGTTKRSRDLERDHLLAKSTWFHRDINPQRRFETRVYEGLVRHGVKVEQLCARKCPGMDDEEEDESFSDKSPNYFKNVLLDGCYWTDEGNDDPGSADCFYYQYTVPVYGSDIRDGDDKRLTLDSMGKIGYLGEDEPHNYMTVGNKQFDIIIKDSRDLIGICPLKGCDHPLRRITVYCCPHASDFMANSVEIESYQSPFPGCSFFIIGGSMFLTERDPDRIYRPLMEPMYVLQAWLNMLITWHTVLAFQEADDSGLYANTSQARPENLQTQLLGDDTGKGSIKLPEPGTDEVPLYPFTIDRLPKKTSAEVMNLINRCLEMMQEYKPNRFQMGLNYSEASNATASANLAALQQSGIPYSPLLDEVAGAINKWDAYTDHQIRFYSYMEPDDANTRYYATVGFTETGYGVNSKRGEQVYLDARKCSVSHDLVVSIENLTWAEKQAKWYLSLSQYQSGVKTVDQLIRDSGVFDVEAQKRLLQGDQIRQSLTPMLIRMYDLLLTRTASANTGFDFGALMQQTVPAQGPMEPPSPEGGGQTNQQAANIARSTVQLPAMTQPSGSSGGM